MFILFVVIIPSIPALLEQSQGSWEGADRHTVYTPQIIEQMRVEHMDFCAPDGESLRMVQTRAWNWMETIIEQAKIKSSNQKRKYTAYIIEM
jgi:broad specificity phosphatase PhoE